MVTSVSPRNSLKMPSSQSAIYTLISSLSHSIVFLYFFALFTKEGFLISPSHSLELCIQLDISFPFCIAFPFSFFSSCFTFLRFFIYFILMLQEGGPLPGPETGLLSNIRKWIVRGDTRADKERDFIGKGHLGGEQWGKGTQTCSMPHLTSN